MEGSRTISGAGVCVSERFFFRFFCLRSERSELECWLLCGVVVLALRANISSISEEGARGILDGGTHMERRSVTVSVELS